MPIRSAIRTPRITASAGKLHAAVEEAAARLARLIGSDSDEITFTSGATESNNLALLGLGRRAARGERRRILVSAIEHKCVLAASRVLEEQCGLTVEQLPVDREGFVILPALEEALDSDVLAVSIMAVNNEIGTIQDIEKISECVRSYGAIFHCDAAQAPLGLPINSIARHTDILSLSGHKMYGPKGVGIIFFARGLEDQIEPQIYGGGQQNGLRSGTLPVPLCVGMGAAAEMLSGQDAEGKRTALRRRRDAFVGKLKELPWPIFVNGPEGEARHPGNANIRFRRFLRSRHSEYVTTSPSSINWFGVHIGHSRTLACSESHRPRRERGRVVGPIQPRIWNE